MIYMRHTGYVLKYLSFFCMFLLLERVAPTLLLVFPRASFRFQSRHVLESTRHVYEPVLLKRRSRTTAKACMQRRSSNAGPLFSHARADSRVDGQVSGRMGSKVVARVGRGESLAFLCRMIDAAP